MREFTLSPDRKALYSTAWRLCLKLLKAAKSTEAKQLIINEWDNGLADEDEFLPRQLDAILMLRLEEGISLGPRGVPPPVDRRLVGAGFWKLLEASKKRKTMCAACYILYSSGNRDDVNRLGDMSGKMAVDDKHRPLLRSLINCLRYRLDGGDRTLGPRPLFIDYPSDHGPVPPEFRDW